MEQFIKSFFRKKVIIFSIALCATFQFVFTQSQQPIRLIIRVDDMGCSHATNTGIVESYKEGIATAVEVMVPTPWFPEAVELLKQMPDLDVGIHLVLTSEWTNLKWRPLTQVPSLVDKRGYFYPMIWKNELFPAGSALTEHPYQLEEIEKELRAQIELAKQEIPQLTHISAHMGCTNINDATMVLFRKLGEEYDLDIFLEDYQTQRFPYEWNNLEPPLKRIEKFIATLEKLTPGNWLYVEHPAHDLPEQQAIGHPGYEHVAFDRASVLTMLTDANVKAAIKKLNIELIGYDDLRQHKK